MDFTTLQLEVRERLGELEADFFTDVEVKRAINEGIRRFHAEERWPWLYTEWSTTLSAATATKALPNDVSPNRVFNLSVDNASLAVPRTLERVEPSAGFRLRFTYDLHQGTPRYYYLYTAVQATLLTVYTVRFIPVPDIAQDIIAQYIRVPADLSAGADEPDMPEEYQEAIAAWAAGKLFLKEYSISQKASEQFAIYNKVLDQARGEMFEQPLDENIAWGREHPGEVLVPRSGQDWVYGRIPPTVG